MAEQIDNIISDFYENEIGAYWDQERKYLDEFYSTIPFPFEEIMPPNFVHELQWNLEHFIGYLSTWSSVKHFIKLNVFNPIDNLKSKIEQYWAKEETKNVAFPFFLRIGYIKK